MARQDSLHVRSKASTQQKMFCALFLQNPKKLRKFDYYQTNLFKATHILGT